MFGLDGSMWLLLLIVLVVVAFLYMRGGTKINESCNFVGQGELANEDQLIVDC
jgi:hypothetical protein